MSQWLRDGMQHLRGFPELIPTIFSRFFRLVLHRTSADLRGSDCAPGRSSGGDCGGAWLL